MFLQGRVFEQKPVTRIDLMEERCSWIFDAVLPLVIAYYKRVWSVELHQHASSHEYGEQKKKAARRIINDWVEQFSVYITMKGHATSARTIAGNAKPCTCSNTEHRNMQLHIHSKVHNNYVQNKFPLVPHSALMYFQPC